VAHCSAKAAAAQVICGCCVAAVGCLLLMQQAALGLNKGHTKQLTILDNLHGVLKPVRKQRLQEQFKNLSTEGFVLAPIASLQ